MSELSQVEQQFIARLKEVKLLEKRMKILTKQRKAYTYDGPPLKVKLMISNEIFMSSTQVLCNESNGKSLFVREILGVDDNGDDEEQLNDVDDEKGNYPPNEGRGNIAMKQTSHNKIMNAAKNDKPILLYFDRDPSLFGVVLNYLRGYSMKCILNKCALTELQHILDDAKYYRTDGLEKLVTTAIYSRFDPELCSPTIDLSRNSTVATRNATSVNLHQNCGVYGALRSGKRYVEFSIVSHGGRTIMIGVTEADSFAMGDYPGSRCKGCSYYGNNGYLYRAASNEGWGPALSYGDRIGILVDINADHTDATVAWYINSKLIKQPISLKNYMDISKGVIFVANLYGHTEQVTLIQNPVFPQ